MVQAFVDGGVGMFPTLAFGLLLLAVAVRYAARPEARTLPLLLSLGVLTLVAGALGFVLGLIQVSHAVGHVQPSDAGTILVVGAGESLQNLALAFAMATLAAMAAAVGAFRSARGAAA